MDRFKHVEIIQKITIQEVKAAHEKAPNSFDLWDYLTTIKTAHYIHTLSTHTTRSSGK